MFPFENEDNAAQFSSPSSPYPLWKDLKDYAKNLPLLIMNKSTFERQTQSFSIKEFNSIFTSSHFPYLIRKVWILWQLANLELNSQK